VSLRAMIHIVNEPASSQGVTASWREENAMFANP
jgi:hypothetical protein